MAVFRYTGKTRAGVAQQGEIEANDRASATAVLRQRQILVTSIRAKPKDLQFKIPGLGGKISEQEIVIFTRQFATMLMPGCRWCSAWIFWHGRRRIKSLRK